MLLPIGRRHKAAVGRAAVATGRFLLLLASSPTSLAPHTTTTRALNIAVITGTTRTSGPPRPILGPRVCRFIVQQLETRSSNSSSSSSSNSPHKHNVTVWDPREWELPLLEQPEFSYSRSSVPVKLREIQQGLAQADAYVTITPEYNHAPSPALLNFLNHFGSSTFSFKPSAIVSYSAGQWGGTRAAIALRPILSELGCLPVSAMIHIPKAGEVLDEHGGVVVTVDNAEQRNWETYADRCFSQLEWWVEASLQHRQRVDPMVSSPAFRSSPSERNAPQ